MKEKLKQLQEKLLLEINYWWGLGNTPGNSGMLVTKEQELYTYTEYYDMNKELEEKNTPKSSLKLVKKLTEEEYKKITTFIEKNLLSKEIKEDFIFDAGYNLKYYYNNKIRSISNNVELYDELKRLIEELEKGDNNE